MTLKRKAHVKNKYVDRNSPNDFGSLAFPTWLAQTRSKTPSGGFDPTKGGIALPYSGGKKWHKDTH
jgi:hypothetical protein